MEHAIEDRSDSILYQGQGQGDQQEVEQGLGEALSPEPLQRLGFRRSRDGVHFRVYQESRTIAAKQQIAPVNEIDWFHQGGACYVSRTWLEVGLGGRQFAYSEQVKGRILGISRSRRIWVLVYFSKRKRVPAGTPNSMDHWWELRLVEASCIEPIGAGITKPPLLPDAWQRQLSSIPFDKTLDLA